MCEISCGEVFVMVSCKGVEVGVLFVEVRISFVEVVGRGAVGPNSVFNWISFALKKMNCKDGS